MVNDPFTRPTAPLSASSRTGSRALQDAGIPYSSVQQAVVGYVYGESTSGQRAVYGLGLTGIPIYNVRGGGGAGGGEGDEQCMMCVWEGCGTNIDTLEYVSMIQCM